MARCGLLQRSVVAVLLLSLVGCEAYQGAPRTVKGAGVGAATGAGTGAAIGAIVGGGEGAWKGAAIGGVVGALAGGAIGNYMDRQAKEMEGVLAEQDRVRRNQEQLQVVMPSDVMFSSGSAQLQPGARDKLRRFADVLNRYPQTTVQVIGHTDSRGSEASNDELSRRRAQSVAEELTADGVSAARLMTFGRGASQPVATNATPEGRAQNRRVEINVNPDQSLRNEQGGAGGAGYPAQEPR
ncbi:MAG: OmpA family protein [Deltaproteobacteria bacterium]|jgi:outer membrane protein OmpA-like peptidoglycan-associated protein|nr:OmpA family protein [Deltaproteobacteria bacterium]